MRRAVLLAALIAALWSPIAPAAADDTVVVPGLAFPSADTYLTYFGCVDLYHADTRSPQVRIGRDDAPAGTRSFTLAMPGTGTASGPVRRVDSIAGTTVAGFSARAPQGSSGVAYVWYVAPGLLPGQAWSGRADLQAGAAWQQVDAAGASYTWTLYDAASGSVLEDGGTASIADFTATNGDGPGYLLSGFGCDGHDFALDALRFGSPGAVTTYDLEAITVGTTISTSADTVAEGDEVTLSGRTLDPGGVPVGATLVLEARPEGSAMFQRVGEPVTASPDGVVRTTLAPEVTTEYRWYLPDTGYAAEGWSAPVTVLVRRLDR